MYLYDLFRFICFWLCIFIVKIILNRPFLIIERVIFTKIIQAAGISLQNQTSEFIALMEILVVASVMMNTVTQREIIFGTSENKTRVCSSKVTHERYRKLGSAAYTSPIKPSTFRLACAPFSGKFVEAI
jgi:hypothetical protein